MELGREGRKRKGDQHHPVTGPLVASPSFLAAKNRASQRNDGAASILLSLRLSPSLFTDLDLKLDPAMGNDGPSTSVPSLIRPIADYAISIPYEGSILLYFSGLGQR